MAEIKGRGELQFEDTLLTDDEIQSRLSLVPSSSEVLGAAYDLSNMDSTTEAINSIIEMNRVENEESPILPPEELNRMYPGLPKPFISPTKQSVADRIWEQNKKRMELSGVVQRASSDPFLSVATFGASLLPHAIDPVNLLADLTIGGAVLSVARGSRAALTARQLFARGAAEGIAGNIATEPFTLVANQMELQDYSAAQALTNVVAGGVLFPAARFGLSKTAAYVRSLGPNHVEAVGQGAIAQAAAGRRVDVDAHIRDFHTEAGGSPRWAKPYSYAPVSNPSGRRLYGGTQSQFPELRNTVLIDEDLGNGIYLTDSPGVANGISARKLSQKTGKVLEVDLGEARIIDLDAPLSPEIKEALRPVLKDLLSEKKFDDLEVKPGRELFDEIRSKVEAGKANDELVEQVNRSLEAAGFDGYRYETGKRGGDPSNAVMLFNDSKARIAREIAPDIQAVRRPSDKEVQEVLQRNQDHKSDWTYDDAAYKDFQEMGDVPVDPEIREIQKIADDVIEELSEMERIGVLDEAQTKQLAELKEFKAQEATRDQTIKSAFACLR